VIEVLTGTVNAAKGALAGEPHSRRHIDPAALRQGRLQRWVAQRRIQVTAHQHAAVSRCGVSMVEHGLPLLVAQVARILQMGEVRVDDPQTVA
jgi:hypothetical protein